MHTLQDAFYDYFPTTWQTVLWRNWGYVPVERIAKVISATNEQVCQAAVKLGLPAEPHVNFEWMQRGYLTILRNNWMICTREQILILLDITDEALDFILKEDDFMWIKLGSFKPEVDAPRYTPLTKEQEEQTRAIRRLFTEQFTAGTDVEDNAFEFIQAYTEPITAPEVMDIALQDGEDQDIRFIYPYFSLYGDTLLDERIDPFPERLLQEYAKVGINGVWMQGLLYQLVEFPFAKELSAGWEKRLESLRRLAVKAKKYGIGIYLYFNEPRAMKQEFFEAYPHLRGEEEDGFYAMCTSTKEVQNYLYQGMKTLFERVPELAGFFTISMSENLTNCYSIIEKENVTVDPRKVTCPRCSKRNPWKVVAEVNNLMAKGAHAGNPKAKAICWTWGWNSAWAEKVIPLLTENQIVQCTSEEALPFDIGGVKGKVLDYTMSLCGPSEKSKGKWKLAQEYGHETSAKVQLNNTWEMAAVPFIPVFDKVAEHVENLRKQGVKHLHASWTLGGCPSPNLKLVAWLMDEKGTTEEFLSDYLGNDIAIVVNEAQRKMSKAFSEFPFYLDVLYYAPQNFGPMAPFFLKDTGCKATLVGFPYDDVKGWAGIYDKERLEIQFMKLCQGWKDGVEMLRKCAGESERAAEIRIMAEVCYCHFLSAYHHIAFVNARGEDVFNTDRQSREKMLEIVRAEMGNVQKLIELRLKDSRVGYESSNHYFYSLQDLKEKMINLATCEQVLMNDT